MKRETGMQCAVCGELIGAGRGAGELLWWGFSTSVVGQSLHHTDVQFFQENIP